MLKSVEQGTNDEVFTKILFFYVKPPARILDCTCGVKSFWRKWQSNVLFGPKYEVVWSDLRKLGNVQADFNALPFAVHAFDCVVFDPPYFTVWGFDPDKLAGGFLYTKNPLNLQPTNVFTPTDLDRVKSQFFMVLKSQGKLIMKFADNRRENIFWIREVLNRMGTLFNLIDLIIHVRPKGSEHYPAALITKQSISILTHAYFFILQKKAST